MNPRLGSGMKAYKISFFEKTRLIQRSLILNFNLQSLVNKSASSNYPKASDFADISDSQLLARRLNEPHDHLGI